MEAIRSFVAAIPSPVTATFTAVGALYLGSKVLSQLGFLLNIFVLSGTNLRKYGKKGTWAVVTGASDGLGKAFATQLAAKGFNLVLVSRTQSKLDDLAAALEAKHADLKTKVLAMDYAKNDDSDYVRLADLVRGLDVGILINNVGQSHSIPVSFLDTAPEELENIVTINCLGTLKTTKAILPGLVQRKKGLVLTMGSFGGWLPTPYLATYSGSKAFLQHWNTSLAAEVKPSGVDAYLVLSYLVVSAMSKVRRPSLLIPTPDAFVRAALGKVGRGWQAFAATYTPFWTHALVQHVVENTVGVGHHLAVWYNLVMHQDIRRRALRKAAREAKKTT
ncbi:beta-keto reductase [Sporothrix brasiliensis 5110]|uniref:Very-long-chain 3-oxoacyl-CoA reductase n=1 Tax=Sporothrix brasiliensis 5110 TaxID=1398154 RepID=A0A0C2ISN5_9PEZI|nr:beta-keto reductase [Sporothrix brasiliensis 5110]KIH89865.1 beta-keto reductase [Sporothrix brasiliensis 5110]